MKINENSAPLVSIVVPTYKRDTEILKRAVMSLLAQTYENIEIVIVDDNEKGNEYQKANEKLINSFESDKILYIANEENVGPSITRNNGIFACSGEYVTFLDDDDEYTPEKVKNQLTYMLENSLDASFTEIKIYSSTGAVVDYRKYDDIKSFDNDYLLKYQLTRQITGTPTFMFKTDKLREIGGFDNYYMGEEFHLMLKAIQNGFKIGYCKCCDIIVYHHSENGLSVGENKIRGEKQMYEFKKTWFSKISFMDRAFIKFRHYAVMTVVHIKHKNYLSAVKTAIMAFFSSPLHFFKEVFSFFFKLIKQNVKKQK